METRKQEEMGRRENYLRYLEQQMRHKQEQASLERMEKERMKSQIKYRAENLRSQEREMRAMKMQQ